MGDMTPGRDWGNGEIAWAIDTRKHVICCQIVEWDERERKKKHTVLNYGSW